VLVGAGRIGTLHALTAARSRGLQLTAVVDKDRTALARLAGLGIRARFTTSLDEALAGDGVDAVIIATPVSSHLPLVRRSLAAELAVLVEKPLAVRSDQLAEYARLAAQMPPPRVQVGYLAPRYPQVEHALERLRAGAYGEVQRFLGLTLLTLIQERGSRRWETQPELSGGGVLINSGGHVMSMVRAAFGDPLEVTARSLQPWSERVEDTLVADLGYTGFHGRCLATWSIDGYPRQENRLVVWTDRGVLTLTNNTAVFELAEGGLELAHQLEFDVGFNLMPDYAGGGIAAEHRDLQQMVRRGSRPAMDLRQALGVERLVFHTYEAARPVKALEEAQTERSAIGPEPPRTAPPEPGGPLILDLRSLTPADVARALGGSVADRWAGFLVHPAQLGAALESGVAARRLRVTVPDFLYQARLIASGRHRELLAHCGLRGGLAAFSAVVGVAARARGASFWVAARGLLAADLARIPRSFDGKLLLQSYLTDLAAAVGRPREATRLVLDCRRRAPRARVGVHTNRLGDAGGLLALDGAPDAIHFLSSPRARGMTAAVAQLAQARPNVSLTAEVGEAPAAVHGHAAGASEQWRHGASGLVVGVAADAELMERHRAAAERAWQEVFPGLPMPEEVL
jgi:predicted dehydrogenase